MRYRDQVAAERDVRERQQADELLEIAQQRLAAATAADAAKRRGQGGGRCIGGPQTHGSEPDFQRRFSQMSVRTLAITAVALMRELAAALFSVPSLGRAARQRRSSAA